METETNTDLELEVMKRGQLATEAAPYLRKIFELPRNGGGRELYVPPHLRPWIVAYCALPGKELTVKFVTGHHTKKAYVVVSEGL